MQTASVNQRCALPGQGFEAPVDRVSKTQPAKTEQVEVACSDLIGSLKNLRYRAGPAPAKLTGRPLAIIEGGEEGRIFSAPEVIVPFQRRPKLHVFDSKQLQQLIVRLKLCPTGPTLSLSKCSQSLRTAHAQLIQTGVTEFLERGGHLVRTFASEVVVSGCFVGAPVVISASPL